MIIKKISISKIKKGPVRHATLPDKFIDRIKAFKQILDEVEKTSLEDSIDHFKRDIHPENELKIWEYITYIYQYYILNNNTTDLLIKKEIFSVILQTSTGAKLKDLQNIKHLSIDQIKNIVLCYQPMLITK